MPQMAPINWLTLYLLFLLVFLIFISINYYSFFYTPLQTMPFKTHLKLNWKW